MILLTASVLTIGGLTNTLILYCKYLTVLENIMNESQVRKLISYFAIKITANQLVALEIKYENPKATRTRVMELGNEKLGNHTFPNENMVGDIFYWTKKKLINAWMNFSGDSQEIAKQKFDNLFRRFKPIVDQMLQEIDLHEEHNPDKIEILYDLLEINNSVNFPNHDNCPLNHDNCPLNSFNYPHF